MPDLSRRAFLAGSAALVGVGSVRSMTPPVAGDAPKKFQLGLVTYNVAKDWDLPRLLRICKEAGVAAVECRTTHKHGVEPKLSSDERKAVKAQFADSGVKFWGCGSVCEFHAADPKVVAANVEECKRFLQLTHDLGGKGVKVRPNGVAKGQSVEEACTQIGTALQGCGRAAADLGLEVWVEVHGAVTQLPANAAAIMKACGHKSVGLTWNSNPTDVKDGSIAAAFELLSPYIKSCHINDLGNDKAGKYPYRELFAALTKLGYDRYTLCEVGTAVSAAEGVAFLKRYKAAWEALQG